LTVLQCMIESKTSISERVLATFATNEKSDVIEASPPRDPDELAFFALTSLFKRVVRLGATIYGY
jgi:hypothetical protein